MSNILQRDISTTGTMSALNAVVSLNINAKSNTSFHLTYSSFVGTATFEATTDGTNWENIYVLAAGTSSPVLSADNTVITSAGNIFKGVSAGYTTIRVRLSAYTSGTLNATIVASPFASGVELLKPIPAGSNVIGKVNSSTVYLDDDFNGAIDTTKWTITNGSAATVTQTGSICRLSSGTTINDVCSITSKQAFVGEFKFSVQALLSQRIANQNLYIELVDTTGNTLMQYDFNGTSATIASLRSLVNSTGRVIASGAVNSTASPQIFSILRTEHGVVFLTNTVESNTSDTVRGTLTYGGVPPLDTPLYVRFRIVNAGTAPASSTNLDVEKVMIETQDTTRVKVVGGNGQTSLPDSIPVTLVTTATVSGTVTANQGTAAATAWLANPLTASTTIDSSSARTATVAGTTVTNSNYRGAKFVINVSAVSGTTPTLVVKVQVQDSVSLNWVDLPGAVTPTISATGTYLLTVYPGIAEVANSKVNDVLPRTYRMYYTIGGTSPSFTLSTSAQYIV